MLGNIIPVGSNWRQSKQTSHEYPWKQLNTLFLPIIFRSHRWNCSHTRHSCLGWKVCRSIPLDLPSRYHLFQRKPVYSGLCDYLICETQRKCEPNMVRGTFSTDWLATSSLFECGVEDIGSFWGSNSAKLAQINKQFPYFSLELSDSSKHQRIFFHIKPKERNLQSGRNWRFWKSERWEDARDGSNLFGKKATYKERDFKWSKNNSEAEKSRFCRRNET